MKQAEEAPLEKTYRNTIHGFTFNYPEAFTVSEFSEGFGFVILVQGYDVKAGIQIYSEPFDEPGTVLTKERLQRDIPTLVVDDPREVLLGGSGRGIAFISRAEGGSSTREVWFVFKERLYQISTPRELDTLLQRILGTWRFELTSI